MCGRMTQQTDPASIAAIFDAEVRDDPAILTAAGAGAAARGAAFQPRYNIAPTDPVLVVLQRDDGRLVEEVRWGLIPSWATKASEGARKINARAETVRTSPAFRIAFARRRCIVPSDGFYEWRRVDGARLPYLLHPPEAGVLAMAGLWSVWKDPATGVWVPSAAVITTDANRTVARLHDRMPVLLPREAWEDWLDPGTADLGHLESLLVPSPDDVLALRPVSRAVNDVRNQGPALIEPVPEPTAGPAQGTLFG
jgi:putative SOS response-associated peptidase YedK